MKILQLAIPLVSMMIILACGSVQTAGTSTETTSGTSSYSGIIVSSSGKPVSAEIVFFNARDNAVDSTVQTDSSGRFAVEFSESAVRHMWVRSENRSSTWEWCFSESGAKSLLLELKETGSLTCTFTGSVEKVTLAGTPFTATVTGSIAHFDSIPAGSYTIVDTMKSTVRILGTCRISAGQETKVSITPVPQGMMFEDFNDSNSLLPLSLVSGTEIHWKTDSIFTIENNPTKLLQRDSTGWYLTLEKVAPNDSQPKALISFPRPVDFSTLDSITFRAKGDWNAELLFGTFRPEQNKLGYGQYYVKVDSTWKWYTIRMSQIDSMTAFDSGLSWATMKSSISSCIITSSGKSLQIDDISFHGLTLDSL